MTDELNQRRRSRAADGSAPPGRPSAQAHDSGEHLDDEVLAGYLDRPDDLAGEQRAAVEAHLASCAACRGALGELRALVVAMSALPEVELTRSFAVTPELAGQAGRTPAAARSEPEPIPIRATRAWHERQMRAVRWATVAAALLFVFVLSADIATNRIPSGGRGDEASAPLSVMTNAPESEDGAGEIDAFTAPAASDMAAEDAAGSSEEMRTAGDEPPPPSATTAAAAAAPADQEEPDAAEQDGADPEQQDHMLMQEAPEIEAATAAADDDSRSLSTTRHYWRLAQVGLALLIVWLLAAMIVLPRRSSEHRE